MDHFEQQKLVEVTLYILKKAGKIDRYHLVKILYVSERLHLSEWGTRITADSFCALKYGPVPTSLLDAIKNNSKDDVLQKGIKEELIIPIDSRGKITAKRDPDMDFLSESDTECIDKAIETIRDISTKSSDEFGGIKDFTHDFAYNKARNKKTKYKVLDDADIAQANGASQDMIDYIREQKEICNALV